MAVRRGTRRTDLYARSLNPSGVMQKGWSRDGEVPLPALGRGCKGLSPQPMILAEEPLDDHHHYRL